MTKLEVEFCYGHRIFHRKIHITHMASSLGLAPHKKRKGVNFSVTLELFLGNFLEILILEYSFYMQP